MHTYIHTHIYIHSYIHTSQGPHSHVLMTEGGGGVPSDFFGSEILARSDLFGSMKDAGIFLGPEKERDFFVLRKKD